MTPKQIRIERLHQLQEERGLKGPVELGKLIGRKTNQTSDLLRGRAAFGEKVARSIEQVVGLPSGWLDQAQEEPQVRFSRKGIGLAAPPLRAAAAAPAPGLLPAADSGATAARAALLGAPVAGTVALRRLELLEASGSPGAASPALREPLLLSAAWVQQLGVSDAAESLRYMHMSEDVMEPSIGIGDVLLVDVGAGVCSRDGVYVLRAGGRDAVRRVRLRLDGQYEVSADSPAVKSAETVRSDQVQVLGRVLWGWRGRRF